MASLTLETFWQGEWHHSADIEISSPDKGFMGRTLTEYDLDYFVSYASIDANAIGPVCDSSALSVRYPVDLERRERVTWPPVLLDLMPQGHTRRRMATVMRLAPNARSSDIELLLQGAANPIGNIRVREAAIRERQRLSRMKRKGVTEQEILARTDNFIEVADKFGMIASGSSALQGEWPKIAMTQASDGLYYPDAFVRDEEAVRHVIVKLLRSDKEVDRLILEAEAAYSQLALDIGLHVHETSTFTNGVFVIPRFDREVRDGKLMRYGQESLISAIGVAEFGHLASHEEYIEVLKRHSEDPRADIVEYVRRDLANRAFGNPDNHGRNTALTKSPEGGIRLSPLFDFAPMRLADEGIAKSTRWASMRDTFRDTDPDWLEVCRGIYPDDDDEAKALLDEIAVFAERLPDAVRNAPNFGIPKQVIEFAMIGCDGVVWGVLDARDRSAMPKP